MTAQTVSSLTVDHVAILDNLITEIDALQHGQFHHIATAVFSDTWSGRVLAYLKPFRTRRAGVPVTRYRWQTDRGAQCLPVTLGPRAMVSAACISSRFEDVAIRVDARGLFK